MGREVRIVPPGWEHPKDENGKFIPLLGGSFREAMEQWKTGKAQWDKGLRINWGKAGGWIEHNEKCTWEEWAGSCPDESDYMPLFDPEAATRLCMYETCSEGTPISPLFETPEELARWLADTGASAFGSMTATYEAWLATVRAGWAPSMIVRGNGLEPGVGIHI